MRHRSINRNSAVASGSSFFNGWRSTPGTTPLTSQLILLISTTTTKVEIGSNAARLRLRSLTCSTGQSPSVHMDDEGATTSAAPPHSFSCLGCVTAQVAVYAPAPVSRLPGSVPGTCFAGAYSPWPPALRSTDTAATAPADASARGFVRFVRRLHRYYDEVRLLVSVHHRLRLLAFPMRTAVLTQQVTTAARHEISQVPIQSLCT